MSTPPGRPHSEAICTRRSRDSGVFSSGFTTTELPQASAGAIFHRPSSSGKLNGTIAPTTPTGARRTVFIDAVGKAEVGI
nr:hypothetical protein [Sporichthya sp.]